MRLAASGAIAMREVKNGIAGPLRKLKTTIPRDDDVVAVDASPRSVVVVFTRDVGESCPGAAGITIPSTRVKALRIDRTTFDESIVDLSRAPVAARWARSSPAPCRTTSRCPGWSAFP